MYLAVIILINGLQLFEINGDSYKNNFKVLKNQDINSSIVNSLIINAHKPSKLMCMYHCSLTSKCLTAVFSTKKGLLNNCFIYNRYFISNEIISSSNSILFEKKILSKY